MALICCILSLFHRKFYPVTNAVDFSKSHLTGKTPNQLSFKGGL